MALRYTCSRFEVLGSRLEAHGGSRLRQFKAQGSRLELGSRLCEFKVQGLRLEALSVQDSR